MRIKISLPIRSQCMDRADTELRRPLTNPPLCMAFLIVSNLESHFSQYLHCVRLTSLCLDRASLFQKRKAPIRRLVLMAVPLITLRPAVMSTAMLHHNINTQEMPNNTHLAAMARHHLEDMAVTLAAIEWHAIT